MEGIMSAGAFSKKLFLSYFLVGLFGIINILLSSGCAKDDKVSDIEDRNGLFYIVGQNKLFSGKVIDTLANKIIEYDIVDGKKNGDFKISSLKGSVEISGIVKNNLNEGQWSYYYPSGQVESEGNFEKNLTEGKWTWYFESGKIREIGNYKAGKKHGNWVIFDEKGEIKRKLVFKDGQIIEDQDFNKDLFT
jgi:antitoxin component YwqK of YwqJK toxin-antitoxin module